MHMHNFNRLVYISSHQSNEYHSIRFGVAINLSKNQTNHMIFIEKLFACWINSILFALDKSRIHRSIYQCYLLKFYRLHITHKKKKKCENKMNATFPPRLNDIVIYLLAISIVFRLIWIHMKKFWIFSYASSEFKRENESLCVLCVVCCVWVWVCIRILWICVRLNGTRKRQHH